MSEQPTEMERRLHEALRRHVFYFSPEARGPAMGHNPRACKECGRHWYPDWAERHASDCLARPVALEAAE